MEKKMFLNEEELVYLLDGLTILRDELSENVNRKEYYEVWDLMDKASEYKNKIK